MIMTSATRSVMTMSQLEIEYERTSRPRDAARISNSTKLPVTKIVSPSLTNPLVNDGVSLDDVFTGRTYKMDEQEQHISITMSEMKKKLFILNERICDWRYFVANKCLARTGGARWREQGTGDYLAINLSRRSSLAEQRYERWR